jgi:transient receptor potential cation channel subfamily V protein 6
MNEPGNFCVYSGFSPMHTAICNGFPGMYDFLVDLPGLGLKESLRGDEKLKSGVGQLSECLVRYGSKLTPLQLACQLGDHATFEHIIKRPTYSSILWKWGPVTQFQINLDGIDSCTGVGGEVLELIGRFDAKIATQEMLLDDFMGGLLHQLFVEKWERFGQKMWFVHRMLDIVYLIPLVANALWLKEDPTEALRATWLPACTLLAMGPCLEEDVRSAINWLRTYSGPPDQKWDLFSVWASSHMITSKLVGCALTAVGCVALLHGYKPAGITDSMVWGDDDSHLRKLLGDELADDTFPIWVFMSLGLLIEMQFFFLALVNPNQELGVLFITINKMLGNDIAKFMKVFIIVFINYGFAMYICYPRTGDVFAPLNSPAFNSLSAAMQAMIELALLGETPTIKIGGFEAFNTAQIIEFWAYILFMFMYLVMALILLLNLLIAMMGNTFAEVQEQAVREWRVANAQSLLRIESLAKVAFANTNSGEQMGDAWYYLQRTVDAIEEGGTDDSEITLDKPDTEKAARIIQSRFRERKKKDRARRGK